MDEDASIDLPYYNLRGELNLKWLMPLRLYIDYFISQGSYYAFKSHLSSSFRALPHKHINSLINLFESV